MGPVPVFAGIIAALAVIAMFADAYFLAVPMFLLTTLVAVFGFLKPGDESPANGRVMAVFAILFAGLPFVRPHIEALALARRERIRTAETVAQYANWEKGIESLTPQLDAFFDRYGILPAFEHGRAVPLFRPDGNPLEPGGILPIAAPTDPFTTAGGASIYPVGALGALVVSVGQDGVGQFPPTRYAVSMDGQPNDPLAPFANIGADLRLITYDPTNGSLSTGDLVHWHSRGGVTRDQAFKRLDDAWNKVNRLTPLTAKGREPKFYAPEDDALTAGNLFRESDWLGTLAAASRAVQNRRPHPNFWTNPDLFRADFYRGYALFQLGHSRAAADIFQEYLAVRPNDPEAHYWTGLAYFLGGDVDSARFHLAASFQLEPNHPIARAGAEVYDAVRARRPPTLPQRAIFTDRSILREPPAATD